MNKYSLPDFDSYYRGSWVLHPTKNNVVQVMGVGDNGMIKLSGGDALKIDALDWGHVQTPTLGYRHIDDGKALYYITRNPGRRREKGVTQSAIAIQAPLLLRHSMSIVGTGYAAGQLLNAKFADAIYKPKFIALKDAVSKLKEDDHSIGLAVDYYWAVGLGLYKDEAFLLFYKETPIASSKNGTKWEFVDADSKKLFERSF